MPALAAAAAAVAAQEEEAHHLPAPPWVFGVLAFTVLLLLLAATLVFGRGRPHS